MGKLVYTLLAGLADTALVIHTLNYIHDRSYGFLWAVVTLIPAAWFTYRTIRSLRKGSKEISW